jgi:lipoate-protein ligase B
MHTLPAWTVVSALGVRIRCLHGNKARLQTSAQHMTRLSVCGGKAALLALLLQWLGSIAMSIKTAGFLCWP